jgi:hypothetical protein
MTKVDGGGIVGDVNGKANGEGIFEGGRAICRKH